MEPRGIVWAGTRTAAYAAMTTFACDTLGLRVVEPTRLPDGTEVVTPVVPIVVADDWKAAFLWKALYDAGVFVNVALHPAVPPAGALSSRTISRPLPG